jgi:hypothetical protein
MFEVDRQGLRKLLERRGKVFALYEIIQNAWDQRVNRVSVTFTKPPGSRTAILSVADDDPEGFADIRHAYTLFAESTKKNNPRQRGRFNIGEKLVIALCEESRIITTTGAVEFKGDTRRTLRRRTEKGSIFEGTIRITNEEYEECCKSIKKLLPPKGISTYFNDELLSRRDPIVTITGVSLPTERADLEGYLRPMVRQTEVHVYEPEPGETGMLYELGIPVVETGDDFHVDVQQKVPLSIDRDNVPPSFLRKVRTAVVNRLHDRLNTETANHVWVHQAMEDPNISEEAVRDVVKNRFGDKVVSYDPTDKEANSRAVAAGYTVVHGRSLSGDAWKNVRRAVAIRPAGQVTPTPQPYGKGPPYTILTPDPTEQTVIDGIKRIAERLVGHPITVHLISSKGVSARATFGVGCPLVLNRQYLGHKFFQSGLSVDVLDLLIHELGHEYEDNHLSQNYYRALTRLGAKLAHEVRADPAILSLDPVE